MKVDKVRIKNFRLLEDITIDLEETSTLIVGRNNTGKTSLTELFLYFLGESGKIKFEDFSIHCHKKFIEGYEQFKTLSKLTGEEADEAREKIEENIPSISLELSLSYDVTDEGRLAPLSQLIMDLNKERRDAYIKCVYAPKSALEMMEDFETVKSQSGQQFKDFLRLKHANYYSTRFYAVDRDDPLNSKEIQKTQVLSVFVCDFIGAQRQLDDQGKDSQRRLSKSFEEYYSLQKALKKGDAESIDTILTGFSSKLESQYEQLFKSILTDLGSFGVRDGLNIKPLQVKALFKAERVIEGNTHIFYKHDAENLLPEAYNGLGYSNLIYMILRFITFHKKFVQSTPTPNFHLVFIEEPEAHLHPQMQQVFVKNILEFINNRGNWKVQIILTTHSSHVIEASDFSSIRYFDNKRSGLEIRNLKDFKIKESAAAPDNLRFLTQYMTLKNCDMFFADKVVMVEGTVERILLPLMISMVAPKLKAEYVSIIEVGGAYAHKFQGLLEFLRVKTLIITDIDSVDADRNAVPVKDGRSTSNAVLSKWLPKEGGIAALLDMKEKSKTSTNGRIRVAYQVPESENSSGKCGRSFEEAFILCNADKLSQTANGELCRNLFGQLKTKQIIAESYELAQEIAKSKNGKTVLALDLLVMNGWEVPRYIKEGVEWLSKN